MPSVNRNLGAFRSLRLTNPRTGERLNTVYWVEGAYIPEAMQAIDHIMRDWRSDERTSIDPKLIDILAATHNLLDCDEPFSIISGYRTPATNALLRKRGRGVARKSYHMKGMAADVALTSRTVRQISGAGLSLSAGGVGRYTRASFVHLDSGPVRNWGR